MAKLRQILVYPIVDALHMQAVPYRHKEDAAYIHRLKGDLIKSIEFLQGSNMKCPVRIVDSIVDGANDLAAVIVHLGGNLYLSFLNDHKYCKLICFVLDGSKLGWEGDADVFGPNWSRRDYFAAIEKGLVGVYSKGVESKTPWEKHADGVVQIRNYVMLRDSGMTSGEAKKKVGITFYG